MTNKEAVNWIINISADIGKVEYRELWHYEQALSEIRELLEYFEPQWIPCSERLPETKTAYYLVTIANYGRFFTTTLPDNVETVRWDYDRRKGLDSWHWCTERTVTAWMPLPEPYREKGD